MVLSYSIPACLADAGKGRERVGSGKGRFVVSSYCKGFVVRFRNSNSSCHLPEIAFAPAPQTFQEAPPLLIAGKIGLARVAAILGMAERPRMRYALFGPREEPKPALPTEATER
jgi:hypothetical protein